MRFLSHHRLLPAAALILAALLLAAGGRGGACAEQPVPAPCSPGAAGQPYPGLPGCCCSLPAAAEGERCGSAAGRSCECGAGDPAGKGASALLSASTRPDEAPLPQAHITPALIFSSGCARPDSAGEVPPDPAVPSDSARAPPYSISV